MTKVYTMLLSLLFVSTNAFAAATLTTPKNGEVKAGEGKPGKGAKVIIQNPALGPGAARGEAKAVTKDPNKDIGELLQKGTLGSRVAQMGLADSFLCSTAKTRSELAGRLAGNSVITNTGRNISAREIEDALNQVMNGNGQCAAASGEAAQLSDNNLAVYTLIALEMLKIQKENNAANLEKAFFYTAYNNIQGGTVADAMAAYKAFTEHCKIMKAL